MTSLSLIVLRCRDLEASREFFSAIGAEFTSEQHSTGPQHYSCTLGGVVLELYPAGGRNTSDVRLGFVVRDLAHTLDQVRQRGGTVLSESVGRAVVVDPDGHKIELSGAPEPPLAT